MHSGLVHVHAVQQFRLWAVCRTDWDRRNTDAVCTWSRLARSIPGRLVMKE